MRPSPRRSARSSPTSSSSPATSVSSDRRSSPRSPVGSSTPTLRSCRRSPAPTRCATRSPTARALTGATIHLVDETLDGGPILAQEAIAIRPGDDEAAVVARIQAVEHRLLPADGRPAARRGRRGGRAPDDPGRGSGRRAAIPAAGAPVGLRQDRPGRLRRRSSPPRLRARLDRQYRPDAPRGRPPGHRRGRGHGLPRDARRPGQDAPSPRPRRPPRRPSAGSTTGASCSRPGSPRSSSSSRTSIPSPLHWPVRGSTSTGSSRRSTSAARRSSGPRPRTTPTSPS